MGAPHRQIRVSRYLARVLRHQPDSIGLVLDRAGWADVEELLDCSRRHGREMSRAEIDEAVAEPVKRRYQYDGSRTRIRAVQGHSVAVALGYESREPPTVLFHGTSRAALDRILVEGLDPMSRQHVHLCVDRATARTVGARHGAPVVLRVAAGGMHASRHRFWQADNGVWLTERVPADVLSVDIADDCEERRRRPFEQVEPT